MHLRKIRFENRGTPSFLNHDELYRVWSLLVRRRDSGIEYAILDTGFGHWNCGRSHSHEFCDRDYTVDRPYGSSGAICDYRRTCCDLPDWGQIDASVANLGRGNEPGITSPSSILFALARRLSAPRAGCAAILPQWAVPKRLDQDRLSVCRGHQPKWILELRRAGIYGGDGWSLRNAFWV